MSRNTGRSSSQVRHPTKAFMVLQQQPRACQVYCFFSSSLIPRPATCRLFPAQRHHPVHPIKPVRRPMRPLPPASRRHASCGRAIHVRLTRSGISRPMHVIATCCRAPKRDKCRVACRSPSTSAWAHTCAHACVHTHTHTQTHVCTRMRAHTRMLSTGDCISVQDQPGHRQTLVWSSILPAARTNRRMIVNGRCACMLYMQHS
jgi:hypothetical protein